MSSVQYSKLSQLEKWTPVQQTTKYDGLQPNSNVTLSFDVAGAPASANVKITGFGLYNAGQRNGYVGFPTYSPSTGKINMVCYNGIATAINVFAYVTYLVKG